MPSEIAPEDDLVLPNTRPKPFVFVLMPFADEFNDIYELGIRAACRQAGAFCERVDEQIFEGSILERVCHQIATADLIVADMSGRNPNVFYEVGYAHALGKRVILLTQTASDIPFDLKHFQHIVYEKRIVALRDKLKSVVRYYLDQPSAQTIDLLSIIDFYIEGQKLEQGVTIHHRGSNHYNGMGLVNIAISGINITQEVVTLDSPISLSLSEVQDVQLRESEDAAMTVDGKMTLGLPRIGRLFPDQTWATRSKIMVRVPDTWGRESRYELPAKLTVYGPFGQSWIDFKLSIPFWGA